MREPALERCWDLFLEGGVCVLIAGNFNPFSWEKLKFSTVSVTELCSVALMCYVATNKRQILENKASSLLTIVTESSYFHAPA